jgi:hypothetical protein
MKRLELGPRLPFALTTDIVAAVIYTLFFATAVASLVFFMLAPGS